MQIEIPEELASIEEIYQAPPKDDPKLILYIQNAHGSYEAQMKIKQLLEYLHGKYGFKLIFVEGAAEQLNPDYLRLFDEPENNAKLADYLTRQGELTGAEYYLIQGPSEVEAVGIEDTGLYRANYEAFRDVQSARKEVDTHLENFERKMQGLAARIFTSDTRRLLSEWKKFEAGRRDFLPFVKQLAQESKKILGLDLESLFSQVEWPQITRLLVLQSMEKDLDRAAAEKEKAQLLEFMKSKNLPAALVEEIRGLGEKKIQVARLDEKGERAETSPRDLLERLIEEAGPSGFQFHQYPAFSLYAGYLILQSELESRKLFDEIEMLFKKILDEMTPSDAEKNLIELYRDHELLRKLFSLELTRAEWGRVYYRREWIEPKAITRRLDAIRGDFSKAAKQRTDQNLEAAGGLTSTDENTEEAIAFMNGVFARAFDFYDFARRRETVFRDRMRDEMAKRKISKAVLITGGFHTDGVKELLREEEINYGVLMPRLTQEIDNVNYLTTMMETRETLFDIANLEMSLRMESREAQEAMGRNSVEQAKVVVGGVLSILGQVAPDTASRRDLLQRLTDSAWAQEHGVALIQTDQTDVFSLEIAGNRYELRFDSKGAFSLKAVSVRPEIRSDLSRRQFLTTVAAAAGALMLPGGALGATRSLNPFALKPEAKARHFGATYKNVYLRPGKLPTQVTNALGALGLTKDDPEGSEGFTDANIEAFRDQCLAPGQPLAGKLSGLMQWLNLFREIRYIARETITRKTAEGKAAGPARLGTEQIIQLAVQIWELMDRPSLDEIPMHEFFLDTPVKVRNVTIDPGDNMFRLLLERLVEDALKTGDVPKVDFSQQLEDIGAGTPPAQMKTLRHDAFRAAAERVLGQVENLTDWEITALKPLRVVPPFSDATLWWLAEDPLARLHAPMVGVKDQFDKPGMRRDVVLREVRGELKTVGQFYLYMAAYARAIKIGEAVLSDPLMKQRLGEMYQKVTWQVARDEKWQEILDKVAAADPNEKPKAKKWIVRAMPVAPGKTTAVAQQDMLVMQRAIRAMKNPVDFTAFVTTQVGATNFDTRYFFAWSVENRLALISNIMECTTPKATAEAFGVYSQNIVGKPIILPVPRNESRSAMRAPSEGEGNDRPFVPAELREKYSNVLLGSALALSAVSETVETQRPELRIARLSGGFVADKPDRMVAALEALGKSQEKQAAVNPNLEAIRSEMRNFPYPASDDQGQLVILKQSWTPDELNWLLAQLAANPRQEIRVVLETKDPQWTQAGIDAAVKQRMKAVYGMDIGGRFGMFVAPNQKAARMRLSDKVLRTMTRKDGKVVPYVILAEGATFTWLESVVLPGEDYRVIRDAEQYDDDPDVLATKKWVAMSLSQHPDALDERVRQALDQIGRNEFRINYAGLKALVDRLSTNIRAILRLAASA
ncbi:MAG: hypothetical protein WC352_04955 [Candidatus Omnitrophota bacterium]